MLRPLLVGALLWAVTATAQDPVRYVSDEIPIALRSGPSADSAQSGALASGARLELLESNGSYARVRTADGREGWVPQRYLASEPPARERLRRAEQQAAEAGQALAQAQAELRQLREEQDKLLRDFSRIAESGGAPPALVREAEALRERVRVLEEAQAKLATARQAEAVLDRRRTLLTGGGLVAGGALLAWLLHWLWPRRRGF